MNACRTIGAAALIAAFSLAGSAHAQVPESEEPINSRCTTGPAS